MDWTEIATASCAAVAAAIGAVVVLGWNIESEALIAFEGDFIPVQYNTALGFLCAALALLARLRPRSWQATATVSAMAAAALAVATAIEYLAGVDLHIDTLFFNGLVADNVSGRLAPNTVVGFLCIGGALLLLGGQSRIPRAVDGAVSLAAVVGAVGLVALTGYVARIASAYQWRGHKPIAVMTTVAFLALAAGTITLAWHSWTDRRQRMPSWLSSPVFVFLMAICGMTAKAMWDGSRLAVLPQGRQSLVFAMVWTLAAGTAASTALASLIGVAQTAQRRWRDLQDAESERKNLNRALRLVSACDHALAHATHEPELLQRICQLAVERGGYRLAWIGYPQDHPEKSVGVAAKAGGGSEYVQDGVVTWADEARGRGPTGTALRTGRAVVANDLLQDASFVPWRERAVRFGLRSSLALPLLQDELILGSLTIYSAEENAFPAAEIELLQQLADDLAFGITALRHRCAREAAEQQLRASEERYRSLTIATAQVVWMTDPKGLVTVDMPSWREFTGASWEQIRGWGWLDSLHPDDREATAKIWADAVERGVLYETEYRMRRHDGEYRHVWVRGVPVCGAAGAPREWVGTCTDITDRKLEHARLLEQAALLELAPAAILVRDRASRVVYWNQGAEHLYGWTAEQALGRVTHDLLRSEFPAPLRDIEGQATREGTWEGELVHETRAGRRITVASRWSERRVDGQGAGFLEINVDMTDRKRAQEELRRYAEELQRSNSELQEFAFVASHDLQEPLRKITAFSERLRDRSARQLDETSLDYLNRMHNAATRMGALIDSLLEYSRVATRALPFEAVDLASILPGILADLEQRRLQSGASITVHRLPIVHGDPTQLRQLFQNLLVNALKFHPPDMPPRVHVRAEWADGRWQVSVSDKGIGFDPVYTEKIFRPFQRLHGRNEFEGSGMGLAICRKIAQRHGAAIAVTSAPGQGATFTVSLPAAPERTESCLKLPSASCSPKTMTMTTC